MSFNWIKAEEFSINSLLLMDRWIIQKLVAFGDSRYCDGSAKYRRALGIALAYNPAIRWYFDNKSPESADGVSCLVMEAPTDLSFDEVRDYEVQLLSMIDSFVVYAYPEVMEKACPYIREWDEERLLSLVDFTDKLVLDVGSGTGRLAFAASKKARRVYASDPVDRLREFMRDKIKREGIKNVVVLDGTIEEIPFEDNIFDIVMSAHVVGDDYERELANLERVVKSGGYIIDCMGEDDRKREGPSKNLVDAGFEYSHYVSKTGGDVYRYWKRVIKYTCI